MLCVCLCDWDKVCPQESILFFYWLLQGKKGRRPWRISFQDSLSPKRAGGKKTVTRKHLEKLYKLYIFSVPPVFTHWMDALKECELSYDNPENRKKKKRKKEMVTRSPRRKWRQNLVVWTKFRGVKFKFRCGVSDIIANVKNNTSVFDIMSAHYIHHPRVQHPARLVVTRKWLFYVCQCGFSSARPSCESSTNAAHLPRKRLCVNGAHALNMWAAEGWEHVE